jgi:hypothetical protein
MTRTILVAAVLSSGCMLQQSQESAGRMEYLYEGPMSDEGRRCVKGCEQTKGHCRSSAEMGTQDNYKRCEEQAVDAYETCQMRTTSLSERRQCYRGSCPVSPDYADCEDRYRACFEGCGGRVWSRQVCEGNC